MKIKLDYNISEPLKVGNLAIFGVSSSDNGKEEYMNELEEIDICAIIIKKTKKIEL